MAHKVAIAGGLALIMIVVVGAWMLGAGRGAHAAEAAAAAAQAPAEATPTPAATLARLASTSSAGPVPATPTPTAWPTPTPVHPPANAPPRRIVAPSIHLDERVIEVPWKLVLVDGVEVKEWEVPSWAGAFHKGSAYPGHPGNTVISGHHNLGRQVFRYLVDLRAGDLVTLYVGDTPYNYRVTYVAVLPEKGMPVEVRAQNARWIAPTEDERLTLVTCWPYTGNTHRVIVVALPRP